MRPLIAAAALLLAAVTATLTTPAQAAPTGPKSRLFNAIPGDPQYTLLVNQGLVAKNTKSGRASKYKPFPADQVSDTGALLQDDQTLDINIADTWNGNQTWVAIDPASPTLSRVVSIPNTDKTQARLVIANLSPDGEITATYSTAQAPEHVTSGQQSGQIQLTPGNQQFYILLGGNVIYHQLVTLKKGSGNMILVTGTDADRNNPLQVHFITDKGKPVKAGPPLPPD